jgi:uncharacterized protein (TIGR02118 family)
MPKVIAVFKFRPDISAEEARRHWNERHPDVVRECIPGVQRYVQNVPIMHPRRQWPFDGVSELWFADMDAIRAAYADPALQEKLHQDEAVFARTDFDWAIVEELECW